MQFSPTHASTKRKITDELKHNAGGYEVREGSKHSTPLHPIQITEITVIKVAWIKQSERDI